MPVLKELDTHFNYEASDKALASAIPYDLSEAQIQSNEHVAYSERMRGQVAQFIDSLREYNKRRDTEGLPARIPENYSFLNDFFDRVLEGRNKRAQEITSPEYDEVIGIANRIFPRKPFAKLCMDGRVLGVMMHGFTHGISSSICIPGGMGGGFVRGKDGKLQLQRGSSIATLIDNALLETDSILEEYDSHLSCAAREGEEKAAGRTVHDHGLFADVEYEKEAAEATQRYVRKTYGDSKRVDVIQTSFDPHKGGYMLMGLETERARNFAQANARGKAEKNGKDPRSVRPEYTREVLRSLVDQGLIISTEKLRDDPRIEQKFNSHAFKVDWRKNYLKTALSFWRAIDSMIPDVIPLFETKVKTVYPHLSEEEENRKTELMERSLLLLTNSFSGYLRNLEPDEARFASGHYEEFVKVSVGGQPPYDISGFVITPEIVKELSENIELATRLVRSNRDEKRVRDRSENFADPDEFREATVPILVQEIVRGEVSDGQWRRVEEADWNDLPQEWDTMTTPDFLKYVATKGLVPDEIMHVISLSENWTDAEFQTYLTKLRYKLPAVVGGIDTLRKTMAQLWDSDSITARRMAEHLKVALPVVAGKDRFNHAVIPFVKLGYD